MLRIWLEILPQTLIVILLRIFEKPISENSYRAAVLRDSSVAQMTTAFRILAFISENLAVATALYDEGAVMVIHAVLIDFWLVLESGHWTLDATCDLRSMTPIPDQRAGVLDVGDTSPTCQLHFSDMKGRELKSFSDREASLLEFLGFPTSDSRGDIRWGQGRDGLCVQFLGLRLTLAWGTEGNSTSDLLLERTREQGLVDLVIPSLVLLVNLLQKLQDAKEQHRNTKLMKALLHLHREMRDVTVLVSMRQQFEILCLDSFMPGPSFPLIGSVGAQPGPHISSSMPLQQKHQIRLDGNII
ncbi:hypothetical protein RHGRI_010466 [Rhododendron griersonianum]|uniref:Uncharacterized protein n=1 Tax=Rhododendron griersonianum TaxID=479676 RepID=A0AAV6KJA7_9ERIC|nr:hypothetical protein RHGRI_010466 [Rhododendron griersonianum]